MRDDILLRVEKPARYIGNEINMVKKNPEEADIRFAFCFPDVYEVGMSHVGLQILYYFFNRRNDMYCERCFAPWYDMEEIMREENIPLFALETGDSLDKFDFLGFTLQYEMSFTNVINMIDLAGIPIWAKDRKEEHPIIIAGGPCAYNPEPLAEIIDLFYIGEGEVSYDELMDLYKENKKNGGTKKEFLERALRVEGIYVPCFYDVTYKDNGQIKTFKPNHKDAPRKIRKVIVNDLDKSFYPEKQLVPLIEVVHDRVTMEVFRGCIRGCRFCQAGYVYRPVRERSAENLLDKADNLVKYSGHEEISLTSLSTGDYRDFKKLAEGLVDKFSRENINISLPSLRIDAFSLELMKKVQEVRKSSLTFAPEAGTQRLRDVINKGITEEEILNGCGLAFEGGWNRVKLYFMVGLPTETDDDLIGIAKLSSAIVDKYYEMPKEKRTRGVLVVVSSSCFVPKPFTPFQWAPQATFKEFMAKQKLVKTSMERKQIKFNYHEVQLSSMEGVLARGDRRVGKAIVRAWEKGAKFDGWNDLFKYDIWTEAFKEVGLDMAFYANRQREYDEILPWDFISIGVSKEFLIKEMEKAIEGKITLNCRAECAACGAKSFGGGVCYEV
ncbi:MAG: TIGR03960 family B12-binding radical SAM protein [Clostridiales bacterium]|nr:TIGR03960 family B12-binding radical SAM protein [Clostridiales bacterium]